MYQYIYQGFHSPSGLTINSMAGDMRTGREVKGHELLDMSNTRQLLLVVYSNKYRKLGQVVASA